MRHRIGQAGLSEWFVRRAGLARFCTFSCVLGLATAVVLGARVSLGIAGLAVSLCGLAGSMARRRRSRPGSGLLVLSILMTGLFAGYLVGSVRVMALGQSDLTSLVGRSVDVELVVTGAIRGRGEYQGAPAVVRRLIPVESDSPEDHGGALGEAVWLEVRSRGRSESEGPQGRLQQGAVVACRASVQTPERASSSGYDQARQLLIQGIGVVLTADDTSLEVLGCRGGIAGWFDRLRDGARDRLSRGPDPRVDEVLQGVVMGDTQGIDDAWLEAFRRSGTAHMLSVSGLHVACLAAIIIGVARLLGAPRWAGFFAAALAAVLMIPFVGPSPPIIRSAVMIVIVLFGRWVGRGRDQWQVLGLAAVVILALSPFALLDVGFQLSFAAFAGMLALTGPLQNLLRCLPPEVASSVAVSVAASAGTAPVALAQFGQTSLVSPLANLLVVPTLLFITGLGMASILLGFLWSGLSVALDYLAALPMTWTILVSRLMSLAPVLRAADIGRLVASLSGAAVTLLLAQTMFRRSVRTSPGAQRSSSRRRAPRLRIHRQGRRHRSLAATAVVAACGLALGYAAYPAGVRGVEALQVAIGGRSWPERVEVRVLDTGQGTAVLVRTPGRHALLFDGGPGECDLGGQLRSLGVTRLDLAIVSHPHADHFAGLLECVQGLEVDTFVDHVEVLPAAAVSQRGSPDPGVGEDEARRYLELRHRLVAGGCHYDLAGTGDSLAVDGVVVRFFAPASSLAMVDGSEPWAVRGGVAPVGDELNEASLVAVLSVGRVDVLLCGDAEAEVLERYGLSQIEAVVVGHHGSRGAVSRRLLEELDPQVAVVPVGEDNPFGHPFPGTVSMLEQFVGLVARTDTAGWVSLSLDGGRMAITAERAAIR